MRRTNLRVVERTSYYRFKDEDDVDPDLAYICEHILKSGLSPAEIVDDIERLSDGRVTMNYMTLWKWLEGKVRRPRNHSIVWVGRALGMEREWVERKP